MRESKADSTDELAREDLQNGVTKALYKNTYGADDRSAGKAFNVAQKDLTQFLKPEKR